MFALDTNTVIHFFKRCLDFTQDNFVTYSLKLARIDYHQWGGESRLVYELTPESPKVGCQ